MPLSKPQSTRAIPFALLAFVIVLGLAAVAVRPAAADAPPPPPTQAEIATDFVLGRIEAAGGTGFGSSAGFARPDAGDVCSLTGLLCPPPPPPPGTVIPLIRCQTLALLGVTFRVCLVGDEHVVVF